MKIGVVLLASIVILSPSPTHVRADTGLQPDRVISITSIEHRDGGTGKAYEVNAKAWDGKDTKPEPRLYYKLACGTSAGFLEVGTLYEAAEVTTKEGIKVLIIFGIKSNDAEKITLGCDVEAVKAK